MYRLEAPRWKWLGKWGQDWKMIPYRMKNEKWYLLLKTLHYKTSWLWQIIGKVWRDSLTSEVIMPTCGCISPVFVLCLLFIFPVDLVKLHIQATVHLPSLLTLNLSKSRTRLCSLSQTIVSGWVEKWIMNAALMETILEFLSPWAVPSFIYFSTLLSEFLSLPKFGNLLALESWHRCH